MQLLRVLLEAEEPGKWVLESEALVLDRDGDEGPAEGLGGEDRNRVYSERLSALIADLAALSLVIGSRTRGQSGVAALLGREEVGGVGSGVWMSSVAIRTRLKVNQSIYIS